MGDNQKNELIVFLSCKKNNILWDNLLSNRINSIIFYGDPDIQEPFIYKNRILTLKCNDTYDYLPVKVCLMIKAILEIPDFCNITHILKVDDHDTNVSENIHEELNHIELSDYCGQKLHNSYNGNRKWHYRKCPIDSIWYNKEYTGHYAPWIDGGCGYILSRKSMNIISNEYSKDIHNEHIYEVVMISLILKKHDILPKKIKTIIVGDKK